MANRLRYGPRFKPSIAGGPVKTYDDFRARKEDGKRLAIMHRWRETHPVEALCVQGNGQATSMRTRAKKAGTIGTDAFRQPSMPFQPAFIDEHRAAEERMVERVRRCVDLLTFGLNELIEAPPSLRRKKDNGENIQSFIDVIVKLAHFAGDEPPQFNFQRKPGQKAHVRHCVDCNDVLGPDDVGHDLCAICRPDTSHIKVASQQRREREAREREVKAMGKTINKLARRLRHGPQADDNGAHPGGHGGDPPEVAPCVEDGGREEDIDV